MSRLAHASPSTAISEFYGVITEFPRPLGGLSRNVWAISIRGL